MTKQAPKLASALKARLPTFDDTPRTQYIETVHGRQGWPHTSYFGDDIPDIKAIMVHGTDGWGTRDKWSTFVDRFTKPGVPKYGSTAHFYIPHDGSIYQLLSENIVCTHGNYTNRWTVGIETGNLTDPQPPQDNHSHWPGHWSALSQAAEDMPGIKLYIVSVNGEIMLSGMSTSGATPPADAAPESHKVGHAVVNKPMQLFSEAQYHAWAMLGRYLAEVWLVPRNFPLRPHLRRERAYQASMWRNYRETIEADPMRDPFIRDELQPAPINCSELAFGSDVPATGLPHVYKSNVTTPAHPQNELWTRMFNSYRGFHSHAYSGSIRVGDDDHNCPGAWFDWSRFARMVWDWWWYPCDLAQAKPGAAVTPVTARRDYGQTDPKLHEHYFDVDHSMYYKVTTAGFYPLGEETVMPHPVPSGSLDIAGSMVRGMNRYWGFWHGGMHFELDAASPIYALACGQIVAARSGVVQGLDRNTATSPLPSAHFVLLRHEVFYQCGADHRINYDTEPARVYSLYMHLGMGPAVSFTDVVAANPTWLNKSIAMKKEYDLGQAFNAAHPAPANQWTPFMKRWTRRQAVFDQLLVDLNDGKIVRFPEGEDAVVVELGDFLGTAGHLDVNKSGFHLEVFSADQLKEPLFKAIDQSGSASRPFHDEQNLDDVNTFIGKQMPASPQFNDSSNLYRALPAEHKASEAMFQMIALRSKSEWALTATDFPTGGWDLAKDLMWWSSVVPGMNAALTDNATAELPADAVVWHYHPLGFMSWLNDITWKSEWPKYRVTDASGAPVLVTPREPPRR